MWYIENICIAHNKSTKPLYIPGGLADDPDKCTVSSGGAKEAVACEDFHEEADDRMMFSNGIILTLAATHTLTPYIPHLTLTPTQSTLALRPPSSPQTCLHRTRPYPLAG